MISTFEFWTQIWVVLKDINFSIERSNPQAPQLDLSMLTEKQEKAIEGILEKLKYILYTFYTLSFKFWTIFLVFSMELTLLI